MSEEHPWEQRPRFERLVKRVAAEGLVPHGFTRTTSRVWMRSAGPDVAHKVEFQKGKWTRAERVTFYVNLSSTWFAGPDVAWPDVPGPIPPTVDTLRLRVDPSDPMYARMDEPAAGRDPHLFTLSSDVGENPVTDLVLRLLAEQGLPALDRVTTSDDCVRELLVPDASVPGAETLMHHFATVGDRDRVQEQYWRLRRHFGHRDFPHHPALRALVASLALTEPPTPTP